MRKDPVRGNDPALTEDDLADLRGLSMAIETCSDAMLGCIVPQTAREALPTLVRLQQAEVARISERVGRAQLNKEGGAA